jgi:membrane-associated PAP2 superfamily phosphatase
MGKTNFSNLDSYSWSLLSKAFLVTLCLSLFFLFDEHLDHQLEHYFYLGDRIWFAEKDLHPVAYFIFYPLPKYMIAMVGVFLLLRGILFFKNKEREQALRYFLVVASFGIFPTLISYIKKITLVPCPYHLVEFGGLEATKSTLTYIFHHSTEMNQCFPAGHSSGGFVLASLVFLARSRREVKGALVLSVAVGGVMGVYQMSRGAHFLSHTLVTECLSYLFVLLLFAIFFKRREVRV